MFSQVGLSLIASTKITHIDYAREGGRSRHVERDGKEENGADKLGQGAVLPQGV